MPERAYKDFAAVLEWDLNEERAYLGLGLAAMDAGQPNEALGALQRGAERGHVSAIPILVQLRTRVGLPPLTFEELVELGMPALLQASNPDALRRVVDACSAFGDPSFVRSLLETISSSEPNPPLSDILQDRLRQLLAILDVPAGQSV
jgi:hypothetical protein